MKNSPYIKYLTTLLLCLMAYTGFAQLNFDFREGMFMIKGQVVDRQSQKTLGGANVIYVNQKKGYTTDAEGKFTLYVYPTDTLRFSFIGYAPKTIVVKNIDSASFYTLKVEMIKDVINIAPVTIYPFKDKSEFIDAFMAEKDAGKVIIPGIAPPKYSNITPKAKLTNPISFLYDRVKKKRAANPDFKPQN